MAETSSRGPTFGLARQRTTRVEIIFALKSGMSVTVYQDTREAVTEESLDAFSRELAEQVATRPEPRFFADEFGATGQRAWVNLAEVAAFSLRPAR